MPRTGLSQREDARSKAELQLLVLPTGSWERPGQEAATLCIMPPLQHYQRRRNQFLSAIGDPVLLMAGGWRSRNYPDNPYVYRPDSNFLLFFQGTEPGSAASPVIILTSKPRPNPSPGGRPVRVPVWSAVMKARVCFPIRRLPFSSPPFASMAANRR